jgi:hypothetical protein
MNGGIINSITRLQHLVGYFYWFILRCTDPWILNSTLISFVMVLFERVGWRNCEMSASRWGSTVFKTRPGTTNYVFCLLVGVCSTSRRISALFLNLVTTAFFHVSSFILTCLNTMLELSIFSVCVLSVGWLVCKLRTGIDHDSNKRNGWVGTALSTLSNTS